MTERLASDTAGLARAAEILANGGLVAMPTETVYGLAADACDDLAVARIYAAKGRPSFNPLIVHFPAQAIAQRYVRFNDDALRLAAAFWPGPLTLVLPLEQGAKISRLVTAGLDTLAVRVPDHPVAQGLIARFGGPIAAPSANPSGRISPTTADHVMAGLNGRIEAVVDGGACPVGLESTIVACDSAGPARLLREGGIPAEAIEACLGTALARPAGGAAAVVAPGMLESHYAPKGQLRLNAETVLQGEVLLGFGHVQGATINLSPAGDLVEAAARLFGALHQFDQMGAAKIAVSPIPEKGLGRAINDRLRRAAAPRG